MFFIQFLPNLIILVCVSIILLTSWLDLKYSRKVRNALKDFSKLVDLVIVKCHNRTITSVSEPSAIIDKLAKINVLHKNSLEEIKEITLELEYYLVQYDKDLMRKMRIRNINQIIN
jgi:cell shape-determining protein MreC